LLIEKSEEYANGDVKPCTPRFRYCTEHQPHSRSCCTLDVAASA